MEHNNIIHALFNVVSGLEERIFISFEKQLYKVMLERFKIKIYFVYKVQRKEKKVEN